MMNSQERAIAGLSHTTGGRDALMIFRAKYRELYRKSNVAMLGTAVVQTVLVLIAVAYPAVRPYSTFWSLVVLFMIGLTLARFLIVLDIDKFLKDVDVMVAEKHIELDDVLIAKQKVMQMKITESYQNNT